MTSKEEIQRNIEALEAEMATAEFWVDKDAAQAGVRELQSLKEELLGTGKYDKGAAIMTIFSGAGGDDAEDFSAMLLEMYLKLFSKKGWSYKILHQNENDHGGYRNITLEINNPSQPPLVRGGELTPPDKGDARGLGPYGILKNESGVHRLVRVSPFNAAEKRHTSFSMVEVIPKFDKVEEVKIPPEDLKVELSRASGPGGQNVNKRETAVRLVHIPSNLSVHVESERSQAQNKEKAERMLEAKLYKMREEERVAKEKGMYISKTTQIEWGNQIRSYVLHPYKLVKDHRTEVEVRDVERVLNGDLDEFLEAEKNL
ncbi:MAG TPA: peptide chain release factor-like protein [Candidatus Paceibacterota bacterium]